MKWVVATAFVGAAFLMAGAAQAGGIPLGGGCGENALPGCVPQKPAIPPQFSVSGALSYWDSNASVYHYGPIGSDANGSPYWTDDSEGPNAPPHSLTGIADVGNGDASISFSVVPPGGQTEPSVTLWAQKTVDAPTGVTATQSYLLKIHTDDAAMASLNALLAQNPQFAVAKGNYTMAVIGVAEAQALVSTGFYGPSFQQDLFYCANAPAWEAAGCGSGSYQLGINYVSGDYFDGGDAHDFYSQVVIGGSAYLTPGYAGTSYMYIDPQISFSADFYQAISQLPQGSVTFSVAGNPVSLSPAPEPASWALMLLGFGLVGTAARRRRSFARV